MYVEIVAVSKAKLAQKRRDYFVRNLKNLVILNRIFVHEKFLKLYFNQPPNWPKLSFFNDFSVHLSKFATQSLAFGCV